jgi:hypothetical protein
MEIRGLGGSSMSDEIWRPFTTPNYGDRCHEISSLGRVRHIKTQRILELTKSVGVSPHYNISGSWWRPDILVDIIFADLHGKPATRKSVNLVSVPHAEDTPAPKPAKIQPSESKIKIYRPPAEAVSDASADARLSEMIEQSPAGDDPLVELAQIFYRPYKSTPTTKDDKEGTAEDEVAQAASPLKGERVRGVAHVLKLYKLSAEKRGYAWGLTDQQAIYLLVSPCHYCGCAPGTHNQNGLNGIDRKNNKLGYLDNNTVACCGKCNLMKGARPEDEFVEHAIEIAKHQTQVRAHV